MNNPPGKFRAAEPVSPRKAAPAPGELAAGTAAGREAVWAGQSGGKGPGSIASSKLEPAAVHATVRILLADDYPLLRVGIRTVIERDSRLLLCGSVTSHGDTLNAIASLRPDVVILAFSLRNAAVFDLIRDTRARHRATPILLLSFKDDPILARRVSQSGVNGFIARADGAECVVEAVHQLARGQTYVGAGAGKTMAGQMLGMPGQNLDSTQKFTEREQEVLEMIGGGLAPREIAQAMGLSVKTIESHRQNIKHKLGIKTATKLAQYAFQWLHGQKPQ